MPHSHVLMVNLQDVATAAAHVAARRTTGKGGRGQWNGTPRVRRGRYAQRLSVLGLPEGQVGELQGVVLPQVHGAGAEPPTAQPP